MEKKKNVKKAKNTKNTKNKKVKTSYIKAVRSEMSKVVWPKRNEVAKYTIATIGFVIIIVAFFLLLNFGLSVVKDVFG